MGGLFLLALLLFGSTHSLVLEPSMRQQVEALESQLSSVTQSLYAAENEISLIREELKRAHELCPELSWPTKVLSTHIDNSTFKDKTLIVTVAKVGTSSLLETMPKYRNSSQEIHVSHSLQVLEQFLLDAASRTFIIVGVRDPIARDLSYFFQTFNDNFMNSVQTKANSYMGEYCYIPSLGGNDIVNKDVDFIIDTYFNKVYHFTFNDWFDEFFKITGLNQTSFNKEKGLDFYHLHNHHLLMIYTMEQLKSNTAEVCRVLGIPELTHANDGNEKFYAGQYRKVKEAIHYEKSFLDALLNSHIMHFFYTDKQIEGFYRRYKINLD